MSAEGLPPERPLVVRSIEVGPHTAEAVLLVRADALRTSSLPGMAPALLRALPGLLTHACRNDDGLPLAEELRDTETAHAFEHVVLQVMRLAGSSDTSGATEWDFRRDGRGVFRVSFAFDDDVVCLGAIRLAERVIAAAAGEADMPDVSEEVEAVRRAAGRA